MGYKSLDVWVRSRALVANVYRLTATFPASESFGLTSQMRRAAVSIPCNIAEGYGRRTPSAYCSFLRISKGSVNELETLLLISQDLGYAEDDLQVGVELAKIGSMLSNLIASIDGQHVREDLRPYSEEDDLATALDRGRQPL